MNGWDRRRMLARLLEIIAAASLGFAVALASWSFSAGLAILSRCAAASLAGAAAFTLALKLLERVAGGERLRIAPFQAQPVAALEFMSRLHDVLAEATAADLRADELLLEDALVGLGSDSRVVQLFRASPLPTAGELRARIDRHLVGRSDVAPAPIDDSGELFEALESLKRSLG
jgi:hypothetical protein